MMDIYTSLQEFLMQWLVLPILYAVNGMGFADEAVDGLDWFMLGMLQVLLIAFFLRPLENDNIERRPDNYRQLIRADIFYTLFHRLGVFRLAVFLICSPIFFWLDSQLHDMRFARMNVESWWPGITSIPWVSFAIYLVLIDFGEYVYHRASHHWNWWWQLHALHHSQRYMTSWTDNRSNIVDELGHSTVFALIALLIGVEPIQYLWLVMVSQFIQSWQHGHFATDLGFAKYLLVSPKYHRLHHAIGLGHEVSGKPGVLGGCNFGILFPWWDMLFKTAVFESSIYPTGVKDLTVSDGILSQQWQGVRHSFLWLIGKE